MSNSYFAKQATVIMMCIIFALMLTVATGFTGDRMERELTASAEWCDEHNGDLVNSNSIEHGGLHCRLPNGTSVHMSDVIDVEEEES